MRRVNGRTAWSRRRGRGSTGPDREDQDVTIERYLEELSDERSPLRHSDMPQLSSLSPEELEEFKAGWTSLSSERRCETLPRLVELSEEDPNLDFSAVFRICLTDVEDRVREAAARGLWECDDRIVLRPLISLLANDAAESVRAAAAMSLGRFAERAQDGKLLPRDAERVRRALLTAIDDDLADLDTKRRAIEAVAGFGSAEVAEIIQDAYDSGDDRLKQSAIYAMGRTSDARWLPAVLADIHDGDPAVRYEAAAALGHLGDDTAIPHLVPLIEDEDTQVQLAAVESLGSIGGPMAKSALTQCLENSDDVIQEAARVALDNAELDNDPLGFSF